MIDQLINANKPIRLWCDMRDENLFFGGWDGAKAKDDKQPQSSNQQQKTYLRIQVDTKNKQTKGEKLSSKRLIDQSTAKTFKITPIWTFFALQRWLSAIERD